MSASSDRGVTERARAAFIAARRPANAKLSDWMRVVEMLDDMSAKRAAGWSYADIRRVLARTVGFRGSLAILYGSVCRLTAQRRAATRVEDTVSPAASASLEDDTRNPPSAHRKTR
ncbi:MAG: hypothetical protein WAU60_08245 [Candidatus Competibacter denitrificans]